MDMVQSTALVLVTLEFKAQPPYFQAFALYKFLHSSDFGSTG
jgi:hypothetical protein